MKVQVIVTQEDGTIIHDATTKVDSRIKVARFLRNNADMFRQPEPHVVFVYGTLKRDFHNHRLLKDGKAKFLGEDRAPGVVYGPFPFAQPRSGWEMDDAWIKGEVYSVDDACLLRLDRLEGHPNGYTRTRVTLESGRAADIYYYHHDLSHRGSWRIPDGNWFPGVQKPAVTA